MNVYFVRHAKSSWNNSNLSDIERPLNNRGLATAPKMAEFLLKNQKFDSFCIFSSPAERAFVTASYFADVLKIPHSDIVKHEALYFGTSLDYIECVNLVKSDVDSILIFGHNPILEELAGQLENPYFGLVPTCSIIHAVLNRKNSQTVLYKDFEIKNIYIPKIILQS